MKKAAFFIISVLIMITIIFSTAASCEDPDDFELEQKMLREQLNKENPGNKPIEEDAKEEPKTGEDVKVEQAPEPESVPEKPESESPESLEASVPTTFIGTEMPKNWPEDIPIKSGIEIESTQEYESEEEYIAGIGGTYFGDPMGLYDFYKNALSSYNLTETREKSDGESETITLVGEKDGAEVKVIIQYKGDEVILVVIGYKTK